MPGRLLPRLLLVAAAALFSTGGAAIKACALTGFQVAAARSGIAALALLLLVPSTRRAWSARTLAVGCAYAATMILYVLANKNTTAANAIFLQSTAPLYILLLGPLLLRERIARREVAFLAAVLVGLPLLLLEVGEPVATAADPLLGNVLGACSGFTWGLTVIGLRWIGSRSPEGNLPAVVAGNCIVCLVTLPLALPFSGGSPLDWSVLIYLGVFQIGLAYVCLTRGIRAVAALEAALILMVEPVLNPVWAWLVHAERPGAWSLVGGALILGATVANTAFARRAPA